MTREQLDALERDIRFGLGAGQTKWARSKARMALAEILAQAREALELREALEWMWKSNDAQKIEFRMPMNGHGYRIALRGPYAVMERHGEGATPLEAINKARRGM